MSHKFYAQFRNFVTNQIRQAKKNVASIFQQFKGDCKSTWKQINSVPPNRINKKNIINKISENDITCETKHDITNVLNF